MFLWGMEKNRWPVIDKIASDLGVPKGTRRVWRQRQVPFRYWIPILEASRKMGLTITKGDLARRYARRRQ